MTAMRLKRYPSPSGGIALGKMGVGKMMRQSPLPPGARWVEYLESTGTQWIDTGVVPTVDTSVEVNFYERWNPSSVQSVFGVYNSEYNTNCYHFGHYTGDLRCFVNGSPALSSYVGNYARSTTGGILFPSGGVTSVQMTNSEAVVNGVSYRYTQMPNSPIGVTYPMALFGYASGSTFRNDRGLVAKMKCAKVFSSSTLVRDFRPIAIGTTGYMLDLVSWEYLPYGNKGTGDFVIGPDINAPAI